MNTLLRTRRYPLGAAMSTVRGTHRHTYAPNEPKPRDLDSAPSEDEIIKIHYLKHHPMYEFKNFSEFSIDPYRYWMHARFDYLGSETYPAEKANMGYSHFWYWAIVTIPIWATLWFNWAYKHHCREIRNIKDPILGVFSQNQL